MFWEFIIFSGNSIVDSGEAVEVMEIIPGSDDDKELGTKTAVFLLLLIFCSSLLAMGLVWKTFPDMDEQDQKSLKFPKTLDDAKELGAVLSRYKEQYFAQVSQHYIRICMSLTFYWKLGVCWLHLRLHLFTNICNPRIHFLVHHFRVSISLSSCIICSLFLFCNR